LNGIWTSDVKQSVDLPELDDFMIFEQRGLIYSKLPGTCPAECGQDTGS
jgi:hypothetical protein